MDPGPIDGAGIAARRAAVEHVEPVKQKLKSSGENELGQHADSAMRRGVSKHAGHSHGREDSRGDDRQDGDGLDVLVDGSESGPSPADDGPHLDVRV